MPYWSIDLLYGLSFFLWRTRADLLVHAKRLLAAQLISVACFIAFPLRFAFDRPQADGVPGHLFTLLGGFDKGVGASLYYIDYMASSNKVNFGCHGYGSNFVLSILDREWTEGLDEAAGLDIINKCIAELQTRFLIHMPKFLIKIVDKDGIRVLEQNPPVLLQGQ